MTSRATTPHLLAGEVALGVTLITP